jgi:hypothetical protein
MIVLDVYSAYFQLIVTLRDRFCPKSSIIFLLMDISDICMSE